MTVYLMFYPQLIIIHSRVVYMAIVFSHHKRRLRMLMAEFLRRIIQKSAGQSLALLLIRSSGIML